MVTTNWATIETEALSAEAIIFPACRRSTVAVDALGDIFLVAALAIVTTRVATTLTARNLRRDHEIGDVVVVDAAAIFLPARLRNSTTLPTAVANCLRMFFVLFTVTIAVLETAIFFPTERVLATVADTETATRFETVISRATVAFPAAAIFFPASLRDVTALEAAALIIWLNINGGRKALTELTDMP